MLKITKKKQAMFFVSMIATLLMVSFTTAHIMIYINTSNSTHNGISSPINVPGGSQIETKAPPSIYPTYTGNGTTRTATESMWGNYYRTYQALDHSFTMNLPGSGVWYGTRLEVVVSNIYETADWITYGDFAASWGLTDWVRGTDGNPRIGIDRNLGHGDPGHGYAAAFQFTSVSSVLADPPQYSGSNNGDLGGTTNWTFWNGGNPTYADSYTNGRDAGANAPGLVGNTLGAWGTYIEDSEGNANEGPYNVYFYASYTFPYNAVPVDDVDFSFWARYLSNNFDQGENHDASHCAWATDADQFRLDYNIRYAGTDYCWGVWPVWGSWGPASGNGDPGDSGWIEETAAGGDIETFINTKGSGSYEVIFRLWIYMDVDDGTTGQHDTWCEYPTCSNNNNEDPSDYLYFWVDGLEFTITYQSTFDDEVDPWLYQQQGGFKERTMDRCDLTFDIYVPSTFFCGVGDSNLFLYVALNNRTGTDRHQFPLNSYTQDTWISEHLDESDLIDDFTGLSIGTLTINFSVEFEVNGWWAQAGQQSIWVDNIGLVIQNYADADTAEVQFKDDSQHSSTVLSWDSTSIAENRLTYTRTAGDRWQFGYDSSTFELVCNTGAFTEMGSLNVSMWATPYYPTVMPVFSVPTEADGLAPTVTWTITHTVEAVYSSDTVTNWYYNLTIPNIARWASGGWTVASVKDANDDDVSWKEIVATADFKNISLGGYDFGASANGDWIITYTSPNKITAFDVQNQDTTTDYEYYPGGTNSSRITCTTGTRNSASSLIFANYTDPNGDPVSGGYPDETLVPSQIYTLPYWVIAPDAEAGDDYVAMVKWLDTDSFNDEVGFAAHYIQVYRNVSVSSVGYEQKYTLSSSTSVVAGEPLIISLNVTDPAVSPSLPLDSVTLTVEYPDINDRETMLYKNLTMAKSGNEYSYEFQTDGSGTEIWLYDDAWMGGVGRRNYTITLYGNSVYLNGIYENYQINGWFDIVVDTELELTDADGKESVVQGLIFTLGVKLLDTTPSHDSLYTGVHSDKINNRSIGSPITDLDGNSYADTWNGSVTLKWTIIGDPYDPAGNLSSWLGDDWGRLNDNNYKWNGTFTQKPATYNTYETDIRVPIMADETNSVPGSFYYINITMSIPVNEWGWNFEDQYCPLTADTGAHPVKTYDDHIGCFKLDVIESVGHETELTLAPSDSLEYYWKNSTAGLTRLYVQFANKTTHIGFNSTVLATVEEINVSSYHQDTARIPESWGTKSDPLEWNYVASNTNLTDGSPDPHQENTSDSDTWGWFYADFNWTEVNLGKGTFLEDKFVPGPIKIYVTAVLVNSSDPYRPTDDLFNIQIDPNEVNLTIVLRYQSNPTFLDQNYYGLANMTSAYYWGDILNFTLDATDIIENRITTNISLRYYLSKTGVGTIKDDWINATGTAGRYSVILNTSDPANGIGWGLYDISFRGVLMNHSIDPLDYLIDLKKRDTRLVPEVIAGVFPDNAIYDYVNLDNVFAINESKTFVPEGQPVRTVPNCTIWINVTLFDASPRNGGPIYDSNVKWIIRYLGFTRLSGWVNTSVGGIFSITIDLEGLNIQPLEIEGIFYLQIQPFKDNYENEIKAYPGSTWEVPIRVGYRPIVLIPLTPISMSYSQSQWANHPIQFVAMDPISGENISGCTINWQIEGTEYQGVYMQEYAPGHYQVIFDTWPSVFSWVGGGIYRLSAEIVNTPDWTYHDSGDGWGISELHDEYRIVLTVESEGFLGPLSMYFYIILGIVGAFLGAYYSYKSYKFLTTPYVIRKIEESVDKISKDKKIAAGVMKSRDHLIFLEATELLRVVGVALKPPPAKKLPPPIEKIAPKRPAEEVAKIPEIPMNLVEQELDKAGVRPEEKPILITQIKELDPGDRQEFIESLIGEERFKELVEELKAKETPIKTEKAKK